MNTSTVILLTIILSCLVLQGNTKTIPKSDCEIRHGGQCLPLSQQKDCGTGNHLNALVDGCSSKDEFCCIGSKPDVKQQPVRRSNFDWYETCGENKYGNSSFQKRVIGGTEARPGEVPWQVGLLHDDEHVCGGVLIDDFHVLTAAHCLFCVGGDVLPDCDLEGIHEVLVGGNSLTIPSANSRRIIIQTATIHPNYEGTSHTKYDVAVLKLSSGLSQEIANLADIMPVCSPQEAIDYDGMECYLSGWGKSGYPFGPKTDLLHYANLIVINRETCCGYHCDVCSSANCNVYEYNFCAGYETGEKDACTGDSGGPLVCQIKNKFQLVGINNWGGCGVASSPSVYISVTYLLDWIDVVINT